MTQPPATKNITQLTAHMIQLPFIAAIVASHKPPAPAHAAAPEPEQIIEDEADAESEADADAAEQAAELDAVDNTEDAKEEEPA